MLTTIVHEFAHAATAFVLGVRSTLFNYSASLDLTHAQSVSHLPAVIAVAGPAVCLALGILSWLACQRARGSPAELPLLYLAVFGVATFFGNLMSASFVGDFAAVSIALGLPMPVRYALTAAGAASVVAIHFWAGRELVQFVPTHLGKVVAMLGIIALPAMLGMAAVILVNWPMPEASVSTRSAEGAFWVFAAIGAVLTKRDDPNDRGSLALRWADAAVLLFAILVVRLIVRGIPFVP